MTLIIGHKGAAALAAENRVESFVRAREAGADGVELDVRRTGDGRLAVWHDPRLPDGRVLLDSSWDDLDGAVDELDAVLDACRGLSLVNVEIKNWMYDADFDETLAFADTVAARLAQRTPEEQAAYVVSCFHQPTVDRARKALADLAPTVRVGWLLWNVDDPADTAAKARAAGYAALHPHHSAVTAELVAAAHDAGLAVNCWTCNDPDRIRELAELGTDGVITDDPVLAREALARG
ncbi:MAG TPA: glycerophosphodiester phosphodiesterase [Acidimicrobiales bacterium]